MPRTGIALLLAVAWAVAPAAASTRVVVVSDPGDPIGDGQVLELAGSEFEASVGEPGEVRLVMYEQILVVAWAFVFRAPSAGTLAPGAYEGATRGSNHQPGDPFLSVFRGNRQRCTFITGRFDVLEASVTAGGVVRSFSADFEQHCEGIPAALRGSIRYRAGDAVCDVAGEGTPCDDRDACTPSSFCHAHVCTGVPLSPCGAAEPCQVPVCDPRTAQCLGFVDAVDDTPCDDGEVCTTSETCRAGACAGHVVGCDDGDPCTEDFCRPHAGCVSTPAPGRCGLPGETSSLLFIQREGSGYLRSARTRRTGADGRFSAFDDRVGGTHRGVAVDFTSTESGFSRIEFLAPGDAPLRPGTYPLASDPRSPTRPYLGLFGELSCNAGTVGRFEVLEAEYNAAGDVVSFAADFEQRCLGADPLPALSGAVRFHVGDATCVSAPDGTPCEKRDLCGGPTECRGGICVGTTTSACAAPDACHEPSACDPRTGTCPAPAAVEDGRECDDGDPCTGTSTCHDGTCTGADPVSCNDHNVCTLDGCSPGVGCVHAPVPGQCWELQGTIAFTVTGGGRSCRCTRPLRDVVLALGTDGTFRTAGTTCAEQGFPDSTVDVPDEIGVWFPDAPERLSLATLNLSDVADATNRCVGAFWTPEAGPRRITLAADGTTLRERSTLRLARRAGRTFRALTRLTGVPGDGVPGSPTRPALAEYDTCTRALSACFRRER